MLLAGCWAPAAAPGRTWVGQAGVRVRPQGLQGTFLWGQRPGRCWWLLQPREGSSTVWGCSPVSSACGALPGHGLFHKIGFALTPGWELHPDTQLELFLPQHLCEWL